MISTMLDKLGPNYAYLVRFFLESEFFNVWMSKNRVGFKLECGAHSDMPSTMWSPSVIAIFYFILWNFWYDMNESNMFQYITFAWKMSAVSLKYIRNLQKLYYINIKKSASLFALITVKRICYDPWCGGHLLFIISMNISGWESFHEYWFFGNLT